MKRLHSQRLKLSVVFSLTFNLFFSTIISPPVHAQSKLPVPTTHLNDTAAAVAESDKQQLENILTNLQQRSGINFTVLTVQTTGGVDIFDYSASVARDWDIGRLASPAKSLLLVLAVEEKRFSIRFSKGVQRDLPDGLIADVNEQMRDPVNSGHVAQALLLGVQKLVSALAGKLGFNTEGMDQQPTAAASAPAPTGPSGSTVDTGSTVQPQPTSIEESKPAVTPGASTDDSKTISDAKSQISDAGTRASATRKKESGADVHEDISFQVREEKRSGG